MRVVALATLAAFVCSGSVACGEDRPDNGAMPLVAGTTYYAKIITVDKQGNQTIGPQQVIVADAVHNADVHPDLQQNFHIHGLSLTLPSGSNADQDIEYLTTDYVSGSGSYNPVNGQFTVGQTSGRWASQPALRSLGCRQAPEHRRRCALGFKLRPSGRRLSTTIEGRPRWRDPGPRQPWRQARATRSRRSSAGSIEVTAGDTVNIHLCWQGQTGEVDG